MTFLAGVLVPLAQKTPDPADVKPGWLGFGMFLALAAATLLLWLSFRRQLKKVRFVEEPLPPRRTPGRPSGPAPGSSPGSTPASTPGTAAGPSHGESDPGDS